MLTQEAQSWPGAEPALPAEPRATPAAPGKRSARTNYISHDDGEGNWLVSYADMMTLLLAFFVILTAFSKPDPSKLEKLREQTSKAMGVEYKNSYEELSKSLNRVLTDVHLSKEVAMESTLDGLQLVSRGTLFFDSASADLTEKAQNLMSQIADVLVREAKGFRIFVEGHTDDVPIVSARFPSNWELSASRAGTVVRLLESRGLPRENLRPVGLADTEPLRPNRTASGQPVPENRAINRRVIIRIQQKLAH